MLAKDVCIMLIIFSGIQFADKNIYNCIFYCRDTMLGKGQTKWAFEYESVIRNNHLCLETNQLPQYNKAVTGCDRISTDLISQSIWAFSSSLHIQHLPTSYPITPYSGACTYIHS